MISEAEVDWRTRERARLLAGILTSSVAPTNTLLGNPAALKRAFETGGMSLVRGVRNYADDLLRNGGMPRQVDASRFAVGTNLAATPGATVFRNEVMEILEYGATTPTVRARPLVVIPTEINKYYVLDLAPGRSLVEYAVAAGLRVFLISWRNPSAAHSGWDLDTYAEAVLTAIDVACEISGADAVVTMAMCTGGITTAAALSHLAAAGTKSVAAAAFGVTLLDCGAPAPVGALQSRALVGPARRRSRLFGVLGGPSLGSVFTWMRPNDLVWNYWVNNYLLGNKPPSFDVLAWSEDKTNLPAALHAQFLDIFERNPLVTPGALTVLGTPVDLSSVKIDTYVIGGLSDHLTPWQGCYRSTQVFGGHSTFVLSPTGHIQTPVSPPSAKAHYFVGPEPGPDAEAWRAQARRVEGTWWDHWLEWTHQHAGEEVASPGTPGSKSHPVIGAAPGTYVLRRA